MHASIPASRALGEFSSTRMRPTHFFCHRNWRIEPEATFRPSARARGGFSSIGSSESRPSEVFVHAGPGQPALHEPIASPVDDLGSSQEQAAHLLRIPAVDVDAMAYERSKSKRPTCCEFRQHYSTTVLQQQHGTPMLNSPANSRNPGRDEATRGYEALEPKTGIEPATH